MLYFSLRLCTYILLYHRALPYTSHPDCTHIYCRIIAAIYFSPRLYIHLLLYHSCHILLTLLYTHLLSYHSCHTSYPDCTLIYCRIIAARSGSHLYLAVVGYGYWRPRVHTPLCQGRLKIHCLPPQRVIVGSKSLCRLSTWISRCIIPENSKFCTSRCVYIDT